MADIFVTETVLNSGTVCNEEQSLNMANIFVTEAVLNNGTDRNEVQ